MLQLGGVVAHGVQAVVVGGVVEVLVAQRTIEAVREVFHAAAEDGGVELRGRQVALHLAEPCFSKHLQVHQRRVHTVEDGLAAEGVERAVVCVAVVQPVNLLPSLHVVLGVEAPPPLGHEGADGIEEFGVALLLVVEKPGALLADGHVGGDEQAVVVGQVAELADLPAVGREGLALQLFKVDVLGLVHVHEVEALGVGRALAVLRHDLADGPGVEGDDVFVTLRLIERVGPAETARRTLAHYPVVAALVPPCLPVAEHGGERVGQAAPRVRHHEGRGGARHLLEILEVHGGMQHALPRAAAGTDDGGVAAEEKGVALHGVQVELHF